MPGLILSRMIPAQAWSWEEWPWVSSHVCVSPKICVSLGLFIILIGCLYHKHGISNTVFHVSTVLGFKPRTLHISNNHLYWATTPALGYSSQVLFCVLGQTETHSLLAAASLSGAGEVDGSHYANCWLILQRDQQWELPSAFVRIKMSFSLCVTLCGFWQGSIQPICHLKPFPKSRVTTWKLESYTVFAQLNS